MMAADPGRAKESAGAPRVLDNMHDGPEELATGNPLHEPLSLCRELLVPCHDAAAVRAAETGRRRAALGVWGAAFGAVAVALAVVSMAWAAAGKRPAGAAGPLAAAEAAAAFASLALLAARGIVARKSAWLADRARVERCRQAKFRLLLDPSLWSRRGDEAHERVEHFRAEAGALASLGPDGASEWVEIDSIPTARTIPVGSGIDPHSVHTLMDYYQARRIDPQLARLAAEGGRGAGSALVPPPAGLLAASVAGVLAAGILGSMPATRGSAWSFAIVAVAVLLPFAAAALRAASLASLSESARRRTRARRAALAELSGRLQKVSGAEAIFRELGFCEDVLESEGRDRIRRDLDAGWIG